MATAEQVMKGIIDRQVEALDQELAGIEARLAKVQPLIETRDKLKAARRALLQQRAATANGGGRGNSTSQEEIVDFLRRNGPSTVHEIAVGVSGTEGAVRAALNRQVDERYTRNSENGVVNWELRDPKNEPEEDDEE